MSRDNWPLSRVQDDSAEVRQGVILIGPQVRRFSQASRDLFQNRSIATVGMFPGYESVIWQKMPAPIMVLGCGTVTAATLMIVLPVASNQTASLGDVIAHLKSGYSLQMEVPQERHQRCELGPGCGGVLPEWLNRCIVTATNAFPGGQAERTAVAAGLHLLYDDLDGSHSLSQTIEGRGKNHNGDYWHAIMHRREPDYDNAKYWFRRVGAHPVLAELPAVLERVGTEAASPELGRWQNRLVKHGTWDPFAFVDACEAAAEHPDDSEFRQALEEIQHFEMLHLLVQSCADAGHNIDL